MPAPDARVLLGEIVGVHGVQGQVRVRTHTADPFDVAAYGPLTAEPGGRTLKLEGLREVKGGVVIARVPGVADRDAAAALKGLRLYVARSALPSPKEEEFYYSDLEGLKAELVDGGVLGNVRRVVNYGAGDMLEIGREDGSVLVPFTRAAVPTVDIAGGRVVVDPPPGLLTDEAEDAGEEEEGK
ncbi:MAG: ribosome maturation factor RimM [Alphaproteobacteria bacterium]|nr:ribosome maturation factor RimM [Alphaproteobacteria bacterium]